MFCFFIFVIGITAFVNAQTEQKTNSNDWVAEHNKHRADQKGSDMTKMVWSAELATLAKEHALKCDFNHRPSAERKNVGGYANVGENLAADSQDKGVAGVLKAWVDEISDFNYAANSCASGKACGHYTQVVWAKSCAVGCATVLCPKFAAFGGKFDAYYAVCNYGPAGNFNGEIPFKAGGDGTLKEGTCKASGGDAGGANPTSPDKNTRETPVVNPTNTGGNPTNTGGNPTNTGGNPTNTGGNPTNTGGNPTNTGGNPTNTGGNPTNTGGNPTNTGGDPTNTGGNPTNTGGNPTNTGGNPTNTGGDPTNTGGNPTNTGGNPTNTGGNPTNTGGNTGTNTGGNPTNTNTGSNTGGTGTATGRSFKTYAEFQSCYNACMSGGITSANIQQVRTCATGCTDDWKKSLVAMGYTVTK